MAPEGPIHGRLTRLSPDGRDTDEVYDTGPDRFTVIGTGQNAHVRLPDAPALNRPGVVHASIVGTRLCPARARPGPHRTYLVLPTWARFPCCPDWLRLRDPRRLKPGTELCFDGVPAASGGTGTLRYRFDLVYAEEDEACAVCTESLQEAAQLPCRCKRRHICTACAGTMANNALVMGARHIDCPLCKARISVAAAEEERPGERPGEE